MPDATTLLQLRPQAEDLEQLVACIEGFAEQHGLSMKDTYALNLASEELFANTIRYSQPPATFVEVSLSREEGGVAVTYIDDGAPFDPTQRTGPDTALTADERPIGGLGIHFIRKSMEDLRYTREEGRNIVRFRRRL